MLIVDDSAFMRKVLLSIMTSDPQFEVVGEARDGREAVSLAESTKPDVITMDINMPHMDGLQATEIIMSSNPRPILIVSSESREGADITLKALELGAIEFVAKPSSGIDLDMNSVREELMRKLKMAAKVRVVRTATRSHLQREVASSAPRTEPASPLVAKVQASAEAQTAASIHIDTPLAAPSSTFGGMKAKGKFPIIVVAASTGGPATLMKFMPMFPENFPGAVLLVQHMPGNFTGQFSEQLAEVSKIKVKEASQGEMLQPSHVYVCPGTHHLRVTPTGRITLDDGPRIAGYRPCADVTLETVATFAGPMGIGVILTGMGNDGSRGIQAIKAASGYVLAQDEASSIIFGMPSEAIKTGVVDQVSSIDNMYQTLEKRVLYIYGAAKVGAL